MWGPALAPLACDPLEDVEASVPQPPVPVAAGIGWVRGGSYREGFPCQPEPGMARRGGVRIGPVGIVLVWLMGGLCLRMTDAEKRPETAAVRLSVVLGLRKGALAGSCRPGRYDGELQVTAGA